MLTNRGRLAETLRDVDWLAQNYPQGLEAVRERLEQHTHTALNPDAPRCTATTNFGLRCKREAGTDGLCGTHRKYGRDA